MAAVAERSNRQDDLLHALRRMQSEFGQDSGRALRIASALYQRGDNRGALAALDAASTTARADDTEFWRTYGQVAIMAGSIYTGYNRGGAIPVAQADPEWNVVSAPKGLTLLLESGVPVRMFPLDSTQLKFDEVRRDRLFAYGSPGSDALALLYHQWRLLNAWGQLTPTLFDVIPVVWLLQPAACPLKPLRLKVDDRGYTRPVTGAPNADVCLVLDESAAQRLIMDNLAPTTSSPQ